MSARPPRSTSADPVRAPARRTARTGARAAAAPHLELATRILRVSPGALPPGGFGALPSPGEIAGLATDLMAVLFPGWGSAGLRGPGNERHLREHVAGVLGSLEYRVREAVALGLARRQDAGARPGTAERHARRIAGGFLRALPEIRAAVFADAEAHFRSDPAATGIDEIVSCYPGLYAIAVYRAAHHLLGQGAPIVPRMLTEHAHGRTGIDIHPGARIGRSFFIDHGTGIVIGETTRIGDRVRIYQGVTLGALSVKRREPDGGATGQRHPTIEDDVIIYANATILGGKTVIGRGAVVGGNAWITYSVPPGTHVGVGT